ncbi:hypothetical protein T12_586 [Trichinella patagoniensis]|uniref:Uncharacterized protein n=1 Tax=Trichinella patagoniensis TaxID=990121 RepID=A0A0V0ZR16_9BILA|nr:hypothetical protein T12_586 [Trichinella patagoniensis]
MTYVKLFDQQCALQGDFGDKFLAFPLIPEALNNKLGQSKGYCHFGKYASFSLTDGFVCTEKLNHYTFPLIRRSWRCVPKPTRAALRLTLLHCRQHLPFLMMFHSITKANLNNSFIYTFTSANSIDIAVCEIFVNLSKGSNPLQLIVVKQFFSDVKSDQ